MAWHVIFWSAFASFLLCWILAVISWFRWVGFWRSMNANRTDAATDSVRLNPMWFLADATLSDEGRYFRARMLPWAIAFHVSCAAGFLVVGGAFFVAVEFPNLVPHSDYHSSRNSAE
ncbi:MAG: hypothetical protein ISR49_17140 [Alphaproteobacteria bacterium]|nr:hypothetical protein [Alphaproteobacteria bacterium]